MYVVAHLLLSLSSANEAVLTRNTAVSGRGRGRGQYIFSDHTYSKPFFLVYINSSLFAFSLVPILVHYVLEHGVANAIRDALDIWRTRRPLASLLKTGGGPLDHEDDDEDDDHERAAARRLLANDAEDSRATSPTLHDHDHDDHQRPRRSSTTSPLPLPSSSLGSSSSSPSSSSSTAKLTLGATARLSLEFCLLWFGANYFASACLEYTSVGSVTILTSTSSVWTLLLGALSRVEAFSLRKLLGVLASLAGVVLISSVDLAGGSDAGRGNFPHKTAAQMAIGDGMALLSAVIYGVYVVVMKRRVGNEERVHMPLFFGLVGLFSLLLMWPGFVVLHLTGLETVSPRRRRRRRHHLFPFLDGGLTSPAQFALPPTGKVWAIIIVSRVEQRAPRAHPVLPPPFLRSSLLTHAQTNSVSSFVSDMSWAYAMLLTTPLIVTVGLSLTIPLSLVGEMIQYGQYSSWIYWVGAGVVLVSFLFINHESPESDEPPEEDTELRDDPRAN